MLGSAVALSACQAEGIDVAQETAQATEQGAMQEKAAVTPEATKQVTPQVSAQVAPQVTTMPAPQPSLQPTATATIAASASLEQNLLNRYAKAVPAKWGEHISGVKERLHTKEKIIALTFDACGGKDGSGYDEKLIQFLIQEQIPATLFINGRWIAANPSIFAALAANPLFEIENHGTEHRPLSVNGKPAYGIAGTKNVQEAIHEMNDNANQIEKLTGKRPHFFRSGTAFYDDVAVSIAHDLGFELAGYSVLGDAGATYNTKQVYNALMKAPSGSIVLAHMNHPEKETAEGVIQAIPELRRAGFRFVQLATMELE
ncbi:polysaccharide deacetylase family protein [Paenibacillus roseipurpureus]|uniref:Polysaccharide deacetylase family protein n=1 Tax=Paenibacillus roseopurpureus TaxID=2918901 RepID=A0AA96RJT5_9BACL|nr:polysaccharide deacetylase family protein [Paenibacillus sp. MBLB1832]WNR44105.1 polysaccharide deacetylase family protein [Paenibacillus sp. MBLB1832]